MLDKTTIKNALKDGLPSALDDAGAEKVINAFADAMERSMGNCDNLTLHGVGEFHLNVQGQQKELVFTPDRVLLDALNEGTVGAGKDQEKH
jgi:nucleoid DNA-binding protein